MSASIAPTEKTLFISFDNDFVLHTEGNIVVIKYDLLNDLFYELGSELVFISKSELSTDKVALITDFSVNRPTEFESFSKNLLRTITANLFGANIDSETTIKIDLPESYIEWLKYHSNPEYNAIGKHISSSNEHSVNIRMDDLVEYVEKFLNSDVRRAIDSDSAIKEFTIDQTSNQSSKLGDVTRSFRNNLSFFPYSDAHIQCIVGLAYYSGIGVEKNIEKCVPFLLNAMELGNAEAANKIGYLYQTGNGLPKDEAKAIQCYKQAGDQGFVRGYANLGYCFHLGIGTPVDYNQAASYYIRGAEAGITFAQANLANIYYDGLLGEPNYKEAFKWYLVAAKNNDSNSQFKAGEMLIKGIGVEVDTTVGLDLIKQSALAGHKGAIILYAKGISQSSDIKDLQNAFDLLDNCERGISFQAKNPEILYLKGKFLYEHPEIVSRSDAERQLEYAIELGSKEAVKLLDEIKRKTEEDIFKAESLFIKKMESLMKKAVYSSDEEKFLNGDVSEDELEGCACFPPLEWENQFLSTDKFGIVYNHQYHRLVSAQKSVFHMLKRIKDRENKIGALEDHYDIEEGIEIICGGAFNGCGIPSLSLPVSLKSIGSLPSGIKELIIPQSVEEIYVGVFGVNNITLQTVTFLNGNIRVICEGYDGHGEFPAINENGWVLEDLFNECKNLKNIFIPIGFKHRFEMMFPSVKDKLEEITTKPIPRTEVKEEQDVEATIKKASGNRNASKPVDAPNKKTSITTAAPKGPQSKITKIVPSTDECKTKSKSKRSVEVVSSQKTSSASAKNDRAPKVSRLMETKPTKKTKEIERKANPASITNDAPENKSFFTKLKNLFK